MSDLTASVACSYYAASSYADKAFSVVQSWPTIVLSQTRGLIAFSGCPRGNIVYTRFSAALSGITCHLDTHPRRSTAMQCSIRRARGTDTTTAGESRYQVKRASPALMQISSFSCDRTPLPASTAKELWPRASELCSLARSLVTCPSQSDPDSSWQRAQSWWHPELRS